MARKGVSHSDIERCENRIALTNEADDSFCLISKHTDNPHIIREVTRGRSHLARLWNSLVDERQEFIQPDEDCNR